MSTAYGTKSAPFYYGGYNSRGFFSKEEGIEGLGQHYMKFKENDPKLRAFVAKMCAKRGVWAKLDGKVLGPSNTKHEVPARKLRLLLCQPEAPLT